MDNTNAPETFNDSPKSGRGKNVIIGVLAAAILGLSGFFIYDHGKNTDQIKAGQTEVAKITTEKSEIQSNFDASLARLDSLTTMNTEMREQLAGKDAEIAKVKSEIRTILNKRNATAAELTKARNLIAQLNGQITDLQQQITALQAENANLKEQNAGLTVEKETLTRNLDSTKVVNTGLTQKVDVASTLNASNITITPVKIKKNGKEKVKVSAKAVDKLIVSFDVSNRIIQSGTTDVYVIVIAPDGKTVTNTEGSGTFSTRDLGEQPFTAKLPVTLETSKTKNVEFGFVPTGHFVQGAYKIQIYQNGFLIGEGSRSLKKGGIFG